MKLRDFKKRIDELYENYGNVDVCINLSKNDTELVERNGIYYTGNIQSVENISIPEDLANNDSNLIITDDNLYTNKITDIKEAAETNIGNGDINRVCILNYIMEVKDDTNTTELL